MTAVSHLYPRRISNKDNCQKSNFSQIIETADHHLADKRSEIRDLKAVRGESLYIPSKRFSATNQFTENLCFETMSIANVRVHVERAIKQITTSHIFKQVLPRTTYGSVNQIWNVCALLLNVQNPIFKAKVNSTLYSKHPHIRT